MTVEIIWMKTLFNHEIQTKKFKDEISCIEWCRKNYDKIFSVNGNLTLGRPVGHFDLMRYLRKKGDEI